MVVTVQTVAGSTWTRVSKVCEPFRKPKARRLIQLPCQLPNCEIGWECLQRHQHWHFFTKQNHMFVMCVIIETNMHKDEYNRQSSIYVFTFKSSSLIPLVPNH